MNITFLIGNGFDVGLGLHSKFSEYFPRYIEESKNKNNTLSALAKEIDSNEEEWAYFEKKMGEYTEKFTKETINDYKAQFKDFEVNFIKYLQKEERTLSYSNAKLLQVFETALMTFYTNKNLSSASADMITKQFLRYRRESCVFNFISFNYTDALEKCLAVFPDGVISKRTFEGIGYLNRIGKVIHVHGTKTNVPIMGVNDVTQIKNSELAKDSRFVRYIVKPLNNQANRTNNDQYATDLIVNSHIICIYGMSLGETDKKWWNYILKWLSEEPNRQLVIFIYDEKYTSGSQFDQIDKEDSVIDLFNSYSTSEKIDVEALRDRIHIAIHKNIFSINLRKNEKNILDEVAATKI